MLLACSACGAAGKESDKSVSVSHQETQLTTEEIREESSMDKQLVMRIDDTPVNVTWEDNGSVRELEDLSRSGLTISMSMYGGFEQVGHIGRRITGNDRQTTTHPGDIVLYSGDQLVVFYGSNSWAYTRLGKINLTQEELTKLLGNGDVTVTLSIE